MTATDFDVLIIGAGLSGIGAAAHLQDKQPDKSYLILEAREAIGGTWDLFRYPGIRSDSDLHTFCYSFKPWLEDRSIAEADSILHYIRETAREHGVDQHIRFAHPVRAASWSSADERWTVEVEAGPDAEPTRFTARWLFCAGGYYRYDSAYAPEFPGAERFHGPIVHPQFWPEELDYAGKRVVVIGSGATAMTIVPAMAERAAHVTMLQRTPSYVVSLPAIDPIDERFKKWFGPVRGHHLSRRKNVLLQVLFYKAARRWPDRIRGFIRSGNVSALPDGYDVDGHFNPPYDPWDQRMCLLPDGDLFQAIHAGDASVVTDRIDAFTERGIKLESGDELEADIIVTATGLNLLALGGVSYTVDGRPITLSETVTYKGMMLTGMPNFLYVVGYINASWTLKADLISKHFCRLLALMDERRYAYCVPEDPDPEAPRRALLDFDAGYVLRSIDQFPKQGDRAPWKLSQDYFKDRKVLLEGPVGDHMRFSIKDPKPRPAAVSVGA